MTTLVMKRRFSTQRSPGLQRSLRGFKLPRLPRRILSLLGLLLVLALYWYWMHLNYRIVSVANQEEKIVGKSSLSAVSPPSASSTPHSSYKISLLASSLQHQNTTYRNAESTVPSEWIIQSVAWIRIDDLGVRREVDELLKVWCHLPVKAGGREKYVPATVKRLWTDIKNSREAEPGHNLLVWIECDPLTLLGDSASTLSESELLARIPTVSYKFSFHHNTGSTKVSKSPALESAHDLSHTVSNLKAVLLPPPSSVPITVCLTPSFYAASEEEVTMSSIPLLKWLEWREHLRIHLGIQRVNWHSRHYLSAKTFVESYNKYAHQQDTYRYAPPLGFDEVYTRPYHDQGAWIDSCFLENRKSSDFILVVDIDEFPFSDLADRVPPSEQFHKWLKTLPPGKGSWEITRVFMSADNEPKDGNKLAVEQFNCVKNYDHIVKSFYRSDAVLSATQHVQTNMYPIGAEIAKSLGKDVRPYKTFWGDRWDSSGEGVWPKLMHYRNWGNPEGHGHECEHKDPLQGQIFALYVDELRQSVLRLKALIESDIRKAIPGIRDA